MSVHHLWLKSKKVKDKEVWPVRERVLYMKEYNIFQIVFMLLEDQNLLMREE